MTSRETAVSALKANLLEAMVNAALSGHDLAPWETVEERRLAYQAFCKQCDRSVYVSWQTMYSILAEQYPVVIHDHQLAVIERCFRRKPNAHAMSEHLRNLAPHGPGDEAEISFLGNHDVDVEAAQRGGIEGVHERLIGKEVRRDDADRLCRARDRTHEGEVQDVEVGVGAVENATRDGVPDRWKMRIPIGAIERLAGRELPILGKGIPEVGDDGTLDAEMQVHPRMFRPFR